MQSHPITIKETLVRSITIDTESSEEALDIAKEMYKAEEIILDAEDYVQTDIYPSLLYDIENNQAFRHFLLNKIQESLPKLSATELAEFAFGNLKQAADAFLKKSNWHNCDFVIFMLKSKLLYNRSSLIFVANLNQQFFFT